jgi:CubicO group peptidase (beta-lactamase class C family)
MLFMKKYLVLFCIISGMLSCMAQSVPQKIDTLLTAFEKQEGFSGSVLAARGGTVIFEKGYGYKNKKENTWNDSNTIFQIGSITKQFTSAIILQLEEKNKLSLQDKLSKYIPDYPNGDQITIEHLLTHTSGVYNYTNDTAFMRKGAFTPISRDSLIATFKDKPLDFHPGDKFSYSNSGYILLGYIIEKVTGESYFQVVRENIFRPLHMDHTGFDFSGLVSADKAIGYMSSAGGLPAPIVDSSVSFAAGAIYTTLGDLYKWDRALYTGDIISPASLQKAFTPHLAKYGYGWMIDSAYGKKMVGHGGGIPGFVSNILRVPEDQTCIIVLDNHPTQANPGQITGEINALLHGKEYDIPHARIAIHLDTTILKQYVGEYQLAPGFILTISLENGSLMSQATGQGKAELFAERENFFFLKVVDAQLEFIKGPDNKVEKVINHQNGRLVTGNKIK